MIACFIDSNVFIHAILKPRRELQDHETEIKRSAQLILQMVEDGEPVVTTPAHISEVANILESRIGHSSAATILQAIVGLDALSIRALNGDHVKAAVTLSQRMGLGFNDTLAYLVMRETGVEEIFSFDRDFDQVPGLTRRTR